MKKKFIICALTFASLFGMSACSSTGAQGERGEQGEKGDTGAQGEKGDKGETAYSCTILSDDNGQVTVNVGSAVVGGSVTFTLTPVDGGIVRGLKLNGNIINVDSLTANGDGSYSYTTTMVEGGFVVKGVFVGPFTKFVTVVDEEEEPSYKAYAGEAVTLPAVKVHDNYGEDITSVMTIKVIDNADADAVYDASANTLTSSVTGEHDVNFAIYFGEAKDENLIDTVKVEGVVFARKLIKDTWVDGEGSYTVNDEYAADEAQYISSDISGRGIVAFNTEASQSYYFETTVKRASTDVTWYVGLTNLWQDSETVINKSFNFWIESNNYNLKILNSDINDGNSFYRSDYADLQHWQVAKYSGEGLGLDSSSTEMKLAISRLGNRISYYINDHYIMDVEKDGYDEVNSIPGLVTYAANAGLTYHDIVLINGETEVNAKIDELTDHGSKKIHAYYAFGSSWAFDSLNNYLEIGEYSEEKGVNFKYTNSTSNQNSGMLSSYEFENGEFTVEYDYKPTQIGPGDVGSWIDVRKCYASYSDGADWPSADEVIQCGLYLTTSDGTIVGNKGFYKNKVDDGEQWHEGSGLIIKDVSQGIHYKLERIATNQYQHTFRLTLTSIAEPTQVDVLEADVSCTDRVLVTIKNDQAAGEYWNYKVTH